MNFEQLKIILKDKNVADLKTNLYNVYNKVPEAKDFINVFVPFEKKVMKQNIDHLFKRYKKQFNEYLCLIYLKLTQKKKRLLNF